MKAVSEEVLEEVVARLKKEFQQKGRFSDTVDRVVNFMWPFTITVGVIMAVGVILFLAFSFVVVYGAAFGPVWIEYLRTMLKLI